MQIAKMFASLGFNIDMGDLNKFESLLKTTKSDMGEFARLTQNAHKSVTALSKKINTLNNALKGNDVSAAVTKYQKAFNNYSANVAKMEGVLMTFIPVADATLTVIKRVTVGVDSGALAWANYATNAGLAKHAMDALKQSIIGTNAARVQSAGVLNQGASRRAGGGSSKDDSLKTPDFFKPLLPTGMGVGGALGAGYALKELVTAGREVQRMDSAVLAVSRNTEDYANNLSYIRSNADRLGIDFVELGQSYGKTFAAAKGVMTTQQVQTMFTGITEYMTAVKLSAEDQKGALRAVAQMFSKDVVQAEEARQQFGERIPNAMKLLEKAAKNAGYKFDDFNKAMTAGMFKPAVLMKEVGKLMGEMANDNGALAKSLQTSAVKQQQFTNAMKAFSGALLKSGLDQLLTDLFNTLTGIVKVITPLVMWLAKGVSGVIAFAKAHKTLAQTIGGVTLAVILLRSQIFKTGVSAVATFAMMTASAYASGGAVAVLSLAFKALKVAIASTGLGLLLIGLVEAGTAYSNYLDGEDNWINKLIGKVDLAIARFKLLGSNIEYAWWIFKNGGKTAEDRAALIGGVPQPEDLINSGKSNLAGMLPSGMRYMGGVGTLASQVLSGIDSFRNNYELLGTPSASTNYSNITPATIATPAGSTIIIHNMLDGLVQSTEKHQITDGVLKSGITVRN